MHYDPDELPLRRVRDYRLVRLTGWTLQQILDAPAVALDWMLGVEDAIDAAQAAANRRSATTASRAPRDPGRGAR